MFRDACIVLAEKLGLDAAELIERWEERAAIREYEAGQTRPEAERDAFEDVRAELEGNRA